MNSEEILQYFFYRRNPFALKTPAHYIPIYRDVTVSDIEKHLNGYHIIGSYNSRPDETCKWGCIDFDSHEYDKLAENLHDQSGNHEIVDFSIIEKSTSKGTHVWYFFNEVQRTQDAFHFLENVLAEHSLTKGLKSKIDIFPRSPHLSGKKVGWMVKLPFFRTKKQDYIQNFR